MPQLTCLAYSSSLLWILTLGFQNSVCKLSVNASRLLPTNRTDLVAIAPWERLRSDIHVWILNSLFNRWFVRYVFPMLRPQPPGIDASDRDGRNDNVDREFSPKICAHVSPIPSTRSSTVVVLELCLAAIAFPATNLFAAS